MSCGIDPIALLLPPALMCQSQLRVVVSLAVTFERVQKMIAGYKNEVSEVGRWVAYMWDHSMLDSEV